MKKAIEIQGTIDKSRQLILDEELPVAGPMRVKVIILLGGEPDVDEPEWLGAGASNEAFEFLKDAAEDINTLTDGKPLGEQGKGTASGLPWADSVRPSRSTRRAEQRHRVP